MLYGICARRFCIAGTAALGMALLAGCGRPPAPPPPPPAPSDSTRPLPPSRPSLPRVIDPVRLSENVRETPGVQKPSTIVRYFNVSATNVSISGSWDGWASPVKLIRTLGSWEFDVRGLSLSFGRYEYKFISDGNWEAGPNRVFSVNADGMFETPPDIIFSARQESLNRVDVIFKKDVNPDGAARSARFVPPVAIDMACWSEATDRCDVLGYAIVGDFVRFRLNEASYGIDIPPTARLSVSGTFDGWKGGRAEDWQLHDPEDDGRWEAVMPLGLVQPHGASQDVLFKFVVDGTRWLPPPSRAPNAVPDGKGNTNLKFDPNMSKASVLEIHTVDPLALSNAWIVAFDEVDERTAWTHVTPGAVLDTISSDAPMGVILDHAARSTTFRLFAPRASAVDLWMLGSPYLPSFSTNGMLPGATRVAMQLSPRRGTWECRLPELATGRYYAFSVDGPDAPGEAFSATSLMGGPRARAVAHATNAAIVMDPDATNEWFSGWTDQSYRAPAWSDMVIYETHVRHLTVDPSSGVSDAGRGKFRGLLETRGSGLGLDHLKTLGVNMIEFMPLSEFENGTNDHQWGYAPSYYFAPEASFAQKPLEGSQYYEFKHLVNELHREGFGVILDVVYNHIGYPNVFHGIDRKYYFRMNQEFELSNFSGCGNDVRTEAPMMRRLIVDNVLYWMREHHVDGFRFDLAELVDMKTLMAVRDAARKVNPNVILISEPWSFRGDHKYLLTGTGWAAWNNEFRDTVKGFVRGQGNPGYLQKMIAGSVDTWAATPLQSINYLESHDDMCLADELTLNRGHDGRRVTEQDAARHRIAATLLFTSLGIPMIAEGQEFMRSKHGIHNTFDEGDAVNAIQWQDRDRPVALQVMEYYRGLIDMRQSARGASFRCRDKPPESYVMWMRSSNPRVIGYLVNARRQRPGAPFAVLINGGDRPVTFNVPPRFGPWRLVGNGRQVSMSGVDQAGIAPVNTETGAVSVPPMAALIYCGR